MMNKINNFNFSYKINYLPLSSNNLYIASIFFLNMRKFSLMLLL
jgi:hypothetical protein